MVSAANPNHQGQGPDGHILVHFNGHFEGQFNGAFVLPNNMYQPAPAESDAQIAARRAMAKRSSRPFSAKILRSRSRKMEVVGRTAKPGIKVDTSFASHRGNVPRQVYPQAHNRKGSGSVRKQGWFGLGKPDAKNKGLGITKGTPQAGFQLEGDVFTKEPRTADSLTPASKSWQEISPWDRPIPIGITVPSDSVTDFSPYQTTRARSDSDATLATPSIIITPAVGMKSVWSPDTDSDYTPARASSIYSRATYMHGTDSVVPPVPALPADVRYMPAQKPSLDVQRDYIESFPFHKRNDTLESTDTAFEEERDDARHKDRIMSTGTVFEEDNIPLRERNIQTLSVDTSAIPTPRRSQGWWNVITTPFVMSRSNSVWTQHDRHGNKTPDIPMMPAEYGKRQNSPLTPSTYIWSATERSPSIRGRSGSVPAPVPETSSSDDLGGDSELKKADNGIVGNTAKTSSITQDIHLSNRPKVAVANGMGSAKPTEAVCPVRNTPEMSTVTTATPTAGTAAPAVHTVPGDAMPLFHRLQEGSRAPININIELHNQRLATNSQASSARSTPLTAHTVVVPDSSLHPVAPASRSNTSPQAIPMFPPPPSSPKDKKSNRSNASMASSIASSLPVSELKSSKATKQRRKMNKFGSALALCRRREGKAKEKVIKEKKKRSRCFLCCGCCLIILILLAIIIPVTVVFTKKKHDSPTIITPETVPGGSPLNPGVDPDAPSQWLNLTGYPPIPTGVSTIAQPEAAEEESGCVLPTTMWSCALPKEQQKEISPNKPDQPNFKIQITFQNGTTADPSSTRLSRRAANAVSAGAFIRSILGARAAPSPSPAAPSMAEQRFLGQTTDGNSSPFEGEETPFFMSFQDTDATGSSRLAKRDEDPTNITLVIPPPSLNPDGTAAAANLLTFPSGQPLRLFNRGKADEHYGFYTFFDRSIFLKKIDSSTGRGGNPADTNGGSLRDAAQLRCTWTQTRFLVQIWTRSGRTKPLLQGSGQNGSDDGFQRPGTFPYPVTVTLDRHGGDAAKKNLFCYRMESDTTIVNKEQNKFFQFEDRTFGGNLVNGTQGRLNATGPIDGGSGGCLCRWQNWLD